MRKILAFVCALMCFSASLFSETTDGIIFAEKLQKILSEGTLEQAINLFSEIPDSLKDDKDLTILKASLIFSQQLTEACHDMAQDEPTKWQFSYKQVLVCFPTEPKIINKTAHHWPYAHCGES